MKLNKDLQAIAAQLLADQSADAAAPFRTLAGEIARIAETKDKAREKGTEATANLWGSFRSALSIAHDAGMAATTLKLGLAVACAEANVPSGSYRSYVGTVANMLADVNAGGITITDALLLSIKDARERYQDAEKKAAREARANLLEAIKGWTPAQVDALTAGIVADAAAEAERKAA